MSVNAHFTWVKVALRNIRVFTVSVSLSNKHINNLNLQSAKFNQHNHISQKTNYNSQCFHVRDCVFVTECETEKETTPVAQIQMSTHTFTKTITRVHLSLSGGLIVVDSLRACRLETNIKCVN